MKDNTVIAVMSIVTGLLLATQAPQVMQRLGELKAVGASQVDRISEVARMNTKEAIQEDLKAIANKRYQKGCEVIHDLNQPGVASTIEEGEPIVAGAYAKANRGKKLSQIPKSHFLGRDVVVCDLYGTTAVMAFDTKKGYAVASDIAVTNDRELMRKAAQSRPGLKRPSLNQ